MLNLQQVKSTILLSTNDDLYNLENILISLVYLWEQLNGKILRIIGELLQTFIC